MNENMCKRFELLSLGISKGVVSKDGMIEGKSISEMTMEEVEKWIEKLKEIN